MNTDPVRRRVVCAGDVIDDIVVTPRGDIRPDTDTAASIRPRPGGSAANTAAWLGTLGVPVDFVGVVGSDDAARHEALLGACGVTPHLRAEPDLPTGSIVILVEGERRTMLTDRGANARLAASDVDDMLLADAAVLHLTGYSLVDGPKAPGVRALIDRAHAAGVLVSLTAGSSGFIRDFGVAAFAEATAGVDLLFANADEAALLAWQPDPIAAARALADRHGIVVVTRGAGEVLVARHGDAPIPVAVPAAELVDPTGAGDALAAGFLHAHLEGESLPGAARAGIATAARAIATIGARPAG